MFPIFNYLLKVVVDNKLTEWLDLSGKFTSIFQKFIKITIYLMEII